MAEKEAPPKTASKKQSGFYEGRYNASSQKITADERNAFRAMLAAHYPDEPVSSVAEKHGIPPKHLYLISYPTERISHETFKKIVETLFNLTPEEMVVQADTSTPSSQKFTTEEQMDALRRVYTARGMTQKQLAESAEIPPRTMQSMITMKSKSFDQFSQVVEKGLGLSVEELMQEAATLPPAKEGNKRAPISSSMREALLDHYDEAFPTEKEWGFDGYSFAPELKQAMHEGIVEGYSPEDQSLLMRQPRTLEEVITAEAESTTTPMQRDEHSQTIGKNVGFLLKQALRNAGHYDPDRKPER